MPGPHVQLLPVLPLSGDPADALEDVPRRTEVQLPWGKEAQQLRVVAYIISGEKAI